MQETVTPEQGSNKSKLTRNLLMIVTIFVVLIVTYIVFVNVRVIPDTEQRQYDSSKCIYKLCQNCEFYPDHSICPVGSFCSYDKSCVEVGDGKYIPSASRISPDRIVAGPLGSIVKDEVQVLAEKEVTLEQMIVIANSVGGTIVGALEGPGIYQIWFRNVSSQDQLEQIIDSLKEIKDIKSAYYHTANIGLDLQ